MSLKRVHSIFIIIAIVLSGLFAAWSFEHARWVLALCSIGFGAALALYRGAFLRETDRIHLE